MAQVKLDLDNLTDAELADLALSIITKLTGNANVPTPNPALIVLTAARGAFDTALAAKLAAEATAMQATAAKDAARTALEELLTLEAATVEVATGGDPAKILSTGMGVKSAATHITEMDPVTEFTVTMGDEMGSLDWQCHRVARARFYNVRLSTGTAAGPWTMVAGSARSKGELNGLAPGATVWVQVQAVGPNGLTSQWSTAVACMVP